MPVTSPLTFDLIDALPAEVIVTDAAGDIVKVNRRWEETARRGDLARKQAPWNYIAECESAIQRGCRQAAGVLEGLRGILRGEMPAFASTYACPFSGRHHWYQVTISPLDVRGERHALLMHVDVSSLQQDALTKIPNRAMFEAQLNYVLSLAHDGDHHTGVIFIDVDHLKMINDTHGHAVGDEALKTIARELQQAAGPECLVARLSGDEFGAVLPLSGDVLTARRVRAHFHGKLFPVPNAPNSVHVSASAGLALYPDDGRTAADLLKAADRSMYVEKRAGRSPEPAQRRPGSAGSSALAK